MFFKKSSPLSGQIKLLALLELMCLISVFYDVEAFVRWFSPSNTLNTFASPLQSFVYIAIVQLAFLSLGLYTKKNRASVKGTLTRIITAISFGVIGFVMTWPLMSDSNFNVDYIVMLPIITFILIGGVRVYVINTDWLGSKVRNVLFLGAGEMAAYVETRMRRSKDRQGFAIHGFVPVKGDKEGVKKERILNIPQNKLVIYALEHNIDEIVVSCDEPRQSLHVDELLACKTKGIDVIDMCDFVEREIEQIPTNFLTTSKLLSTGGFQSGNHARNVFDWFFNVGLAYILFVLTWPIMLVTALLIKLEDGWSSPVLYSQERVGVKGETFNIYKFRSMSIDAEKNGAQMAGVKDSRVTKIGHYIRKFRIDELPQIFNVMRGDMGFVGPRPERPVFVNELVQKYGYFSERHNVKPGLTGWAQLMYPYGATHHDSFEKLKFDLYYIKHRSFVFDILILIRTIEVVIFGKGR